jgi:hypothetical protein
MLRPATNDQADTDGQASTAPGRDNNVMTTTNGRRLDTPQKVKAFLAELEAERAGEEHDHGA